MEPNDRAYHRQMYIDLIRAYLREYGTEKKLALALSAAGGLLHQRAEIMRLYQSRSSPLCRSM